MREPRRGCRQWIACAKPEQELALKDGADNRHCVNPGHEGAEAVVCRESQLRGEISCNEEKFASEKD